MRSSLLLLVLSLCASFVITVSLPAQYEHGIFPLPFDAVEEEVEVGRLRRFHCNGREDVNKVLELLENEEDALDVWQIAESYIDIYFPSSAGPSPALSSHPHTVIPTSSSYSAAPSYSSPPDVPSLDSLNTTYHAAYHPLLAIYSFLTSLADQYPDQVTVIPLGHSGQGREMLGIRITSADPEMREARRTASTSKKAGFVITGAQHAREWVAISSSLYLTHALVANASEPGSLSHLLNTYDFYIIPVPNPDGYEYTWTTDRLWYKNRMALGPDAKCVGVDLGRNWGYKWGGHRPFEAPEVNNLANFIMTIPRLKAFVDLRSYGQMISIPYSFSCKKIPKDAEDLLEAALGAAQAARKSHGTAFQTGALCNTLYRAPGNIIDYMYKQAGTKYSYAVHLRDTGTYGFSLPEELLRPVGEETADMIEYLANFIVTKRGTLKYPYTSTID
ncbi:hypothetical protein NEOLEDRAFT_1199694 [Neolentinus lepideus HHB14362 ss-1]|uniref:Inactive metallocarboxypeptidase ECM14 n=1 Tax=Neolentinus lepideus HHB14362 ss-1 TaxID=1314782 RepID=A0A165T0A6_9AGAM|nr:hypothetical protein NEOLEDRAFT_1199694 [Neolentinus lepideus HHB14362 ss-1]